MRANLNLSQPAASLFLPQLSLQPRSHFPFPQNCIPARFGLKPQTPPLYTITHSQMYKISWIKKRECVFKIQVIQKSCHTS